MPTNSEPVQFDQLPKEYDARTAQRVMEASVRRVLNSSERHVPETPVGRVASATDSEVMAWLL